MKQRLFPIATWTVIATLFAFVGCKGTQPDEVRIGALLALTGSGANYGKSLRQGIELAKEEINLLGGINGKKLKILYEDSQGDAKTGISAFNKLSVVDKVPLVLGSISSVVLAVAPIADENQVVLVNSSAISPKICEKADNFLFSFMVSGADEARFMASELANRHQGEAIAVLYSNNASGVDTKDSFVRQLTQQGGTIALAEGYELNATDFRPNLTKIAASGAKLGYLIAFSSAEFAKILVQTKELGLQIQWYSYSGIETKETLDLAGNAAEGVIYSYPKYDPNDPDMELFQTKYSNRYNGWPDIYTVTSYDAVKLLAKVISKSGTDAANIRDALRKAGTYKGLFGELKYKDKQCVEMHLMWKTVMNGKFVLAS